MAKIRDNDGNHVEVPQLGDVPGQTDINDAVAAALAEIDVTPEVAQNVVNQTFVTEVVNQITEVTENNEFIEQIVHNDTYITELVTKLTELTEIEVSNTYVTNVINQINAHINGKKGIANELATLDTDAQLTPSQTPIELRRRTINFIIDGAGSVPGTGAKGVVEIPFACHIVSARIVGDQASGSAVVDVKKSTYANLGSATSIAASAKPTLSSARQAQDTTLTGWTKAIAAGDWLEFNLDSVATHTRVTVAIGVTVDV